jgi:ribosomal-protein-alanine N-acetyltransferase
MVETSIISFPELTTKRLLLRRLRSSDDHNLLAIRSNQSVATHIGRPITQSLEEVRVFMAKINEEIAQKECLYWAISNKKTENFAGTICFWNFSLERDSAEIGYELHPDFQGRGIMQEALERVVAFGFETLQLQKIIAHVSENNHPSIRLMVRNNFIRVDLAFGEKANKMEIDSNTHGYMLINQHTLVPSVYYPDKKESQ